MMKRFQTVMWYHSGKKKKTSKEIRNKNYQKKNKKKTHDVYILERYPEFGRCVMIYATRRREMSRIVR